MANYEKSQIKLPPSERQLVYLAQLLEDAGKRLSKNEWNDLNKTSASRLIDKLLNEKELGLEKSSHLGCSGLMVAIIAVLVLVAILAIAFQNHDEDDINPENIGSSATIPASNDKVEKETVIVKLGKIMTLDDKIYYEVSVLEIKDGRAIILHRDGKEEMPLSNLYPGELEKMGLNPAHYHNADE